MKMMKMTMIYFMGILLALSSAGCSTNQKSEGNKVPTQQPAVTQEEKPTQASTEVKKDGKNPLVTIEMENGDIIKIKLYPEIAPNTVKNFVSLINKKFYDGLTFHRVIPGFMIQGGDPSGNGTGGPGYGIKGEFSENNFNNPLKHARGVISMARSNAPDSAGSQFFIMVKDSSFLDGKYAAFGEVTEGIENADKIVNVQRDPSDKPLTPQKMKKVTVDTFGQKFDEPQVIK